MVDSNSNSYFIIIILCLQTLYNCILSINGQYIYRYFLRTYPDHFTNWTNITHSSLIASASELVREQCTENMTTTAQESAETWAQQRSADLIFEATLWRAFPVIITTYLFGIYASKLNRRLVLILSIFGNGIHVVIYQAIIYKHLGDYWWYVSAFIAGLAGGTNLLGIVINLIVTESTQENERSSRFVVLGAVSTALSAIAMFGIGYYIQWRGFTDLFWIAIGLEILSILAVIFFLKPTHSSITIDETTSLLSSQSSCTNDASVTSKKTSTFSNCFHCFDMCTVFSFQHRSRKKSLSLILILVSYVFYLLASSATAPVLWYLLGSPFCWSSEDLGNFSAVSLISTAIFSVLGMKALSYCGVDDAIICALGNICFFGYSLWIALAKYSWQLYLSLLINPFSGYQNALAVSMISKSLEIHERTHIYTLMTEINTIILAFGSSFFNWVYARTVTHQKNFTLLVGSGLCIIPFILNLCLFLIIRRNSQVQEPTVVSDLNVEPITLSMSSNLPPQATDTACLVLPSRSRSDSLSASQNNRSRANSDLSVDDQNDRYLTI